MLNVCLKMKHLKYSFVGLLLLASALFIVIPTQNHGIFGQNANTTNTTESENPAFDGQNPGFVPQTEDGTAPPPPPSDATKVEDLPKETLVKDPDSDPLSISNRTEILEVLPANSTKIIKFVDEDLKNTTGVGLAPADVLEKLTSKSNDNKSILQLATPDEIKQIKIIAITNATGGEDEEDEPTANATTEETEGGEETNATTVTGGEEPFGIVETNLTNATGGEEQAQAGQGEQQGAADGEEQAQAGGEETNVTNATSGEQPAQAREEQKQAEGEEEQANTAEEEQAQAGQGEQEEAITNATNATGTQAPEELLNTTNDTSILNTTDSEDENDSPEND
jgi:hypothetical protein